MQGKATRTPARDKVRPFIPKALAEGWSIRKLAKEAGVSTGVAGSELKDASKQTEAELSSSLASQQNKSMRVAQRLRDAQIDRAERLNALQEQLLADLEEKARKNREWKGKEKDRPPALNGREVETMIKLQERHWLHTKDMAGIAVAEKIAVNQAKGQAQGAAIGQALVDATAVRVGEGVWINAQGDEVQEAEGKTVD